MTRRYVSAGVAGSPQFCKPGCNFERQIIDVTTRGSVVRTDALVRNLANDDRDRNRIDRQRRDSSRFWHDETGWSRMIELACYSTRLFFQSSQLLAFFFFLSVKRTTRDDLF